MKKNTLALNIGEEALIEGFGVVKCIEDKFILGACSRCCLYMNKTCNAISIAGIKNGGYCIRDKRLNNNLNDCDNGVIYTRVTAVVKPKNN